MASKQGDADLKMSFWDHLDVLRGTLLRSVLYLCAFAVLGFIFREPLFSLILAPTGSGFFVYRLLGWDMGLELVNIELSGQFFVHMKAAVSLGLVFALPLILFEIWKFIAPALYANEKGPVRMAFLLGGCFFYLGVVVGYVVLLPVCMQFFVNYSVSETVVNTISLSSYMSMFNSMVLLVGLVFEFPMLMMLLSRLGIISAGMLKGKRKHAFVAILVVAAFITPADPFSMFVLAAPLYLLYELSIWLCKSPETN